ncbi:MAG TPA: hypothetical protein VHE09_03205 [Rhizomicrobium sp.]|jgi:hypothetical protein|nr:hypothetical protein [Rhizomicrobium sp.]
MSKVLRPLLVALAVIGFSATGAVAAEKASAPPGPPQPYKNKVTNFAYNLLFCDIPALFIQNKNLKSDTPLYRVLHAGAKDSGAVRAIAMDAQGDSCTRMLAFDWLRAHKQTVPPKVVLGVVFEMGSKDGPATVAAYADGNVRFISDTEELASFPPNTPSIAPKAKDLLARAQTMIKKMDAWKEPRVIAPPYGIMRITFLASGGLYFGDGEFRHMVHDKFGGPAIHSAVDLMKAVSK